MIVAEITKDKLWTTKDDYPTRAGLKFSLGEVRDAIAFGDFDQSTMPTYRTLFRLRDEDNLVHYEGWLYNDEECLIQEYLSNWGARDTGGFIIEVWDNENKTWNMEIG